MTFIVAFNPGGETDVTARLQQPFFEKVTGQPLVIQYKPGAGGAQAWSGLRIQRYHALRTLSGADEADLPPSASISKIFWASWHRDLGKLAMDVLGPDAEIAEGAPYELSGLQRMFLFTRSDTIYAGSNQIQRNIIAERTLGLPREPR